MNQRLLVLASIAITAVCGCTGTGTNNGQNWMSNSGTRIAPPGTNLGQQVASLPPDPYYGNTPGGSVQTNGAPGWQQAAASQNIQSAPGSPVPNSNLVVASSTAGVTVPPATTLASNQVPGAIPPQQPGVSYGTVASGALPLNDATRVATSPAVQQPNTGIFNRTWEYVAQPNAPNNPVTQYTTQPQYAAQPQYATQPQYSPQPVYANGTVVAASSTAPGYAAPRPSSYTNPNAYPGYPNVTPVNNNVAQGWQQRTAPR